MLTLYKEKRGSRQFYAGWKKDFYIVSLGADVDIVPFSQFAGNMRCRMIVKAHHLNKGRQPRVTHRIAREIYEMKKDEIEELFLRFYPV